MDPEMITAIRSGDGDQIKKLGKEKPHLFTKRSPQGNTVLHVAVRYGNSSVVSEILNFQNSFLFDKNCKGETPLHLAVVSSNNDVFDTLLNYKDSGKGEIGEVNIMMIPDDEGNLPLHVAVKNDHHLMAWAMLRRDGDLVRFVNDAGQSPLSIAIDSCFFYSAYLIIEKGPKDYNHGGNLIKLLRALILRKQNNYDYLYEELSWKDHVNDMDEKGRNLLHYAAVAGNDFITEKLLRTNSSLAYKRDCNGQTPLHLAARNGQLMSLHNLINICPDATEVLDNEKHNILHIAAEYGQVNIVLYLLKIREFEEFINSCDKDGNTPLHLAAMNFNIGVINILSKNKKFKIRATNKKNQTALQVVLEASEDPKKALQKHLIIKALKAAYAYQALKADDILDNSHFKGISNIDGNNEHKEMAQILSVIATLVATFTFTAAFTIPGGFISDGPDQGLAALARKTAFQAFVVTDTVAMTAAIVVFWAFWHRGAGAFMDILPSAIGLIWIGLVSMTIAFVTGLFAVLSNNLTLAIVVCSIGCVLPFIFYVVAPLSPLLLSKSELALTEDDPFAFTLQMVKKFLKKPLKLIDYVLELISIVLPGILFVSYRIVAYCLFRLRTIQWRKSSNSVI